MELAQPTGRKLAFYRAEPSAEYWSAHWAQQTPEEVLGVAERSPLTRFLERHIRSGMRVLEAGCGLGQYVRYFSERGVEIYGVDFSEAAISRHFEVWPDSRLLVGDLRELPFGDASFDAYVSIGVIEHYEHGPDRVLSEARRVLRPDGFAIVSTPYLSLTRRLLRPRIESREAAKQTSGVPFYQYAFDERTLDAVLGAADFSVVERSYYDPGRGLRDIRHLLAPAPRHIDGGGLAKHRRGRPVDARVKRLLLYNGLTLKMLAHMQIVRARR